MFNSNEKLKKIEEAKAEAKKKKNMKFFKYIVRRNI